MQRSFKVGVDVNVLRIKPNCSQLPQSLTIVLHGSSHQGFY